MRKAVVFAFVLMGLFLGVSILLNPNERRTPRGDPTALTDSQRLEIAAKCSQSPNSLTCR